MSKDNLFLNTIQFPRKIANKIEDAALSSPWFFFSDCAHGEDAREKGLDMHPYFSYSLVKDRVAKGGEWMSKYDLAFFSKYIRMNTHPMIRAHVTFHWPRPESFGIPHNFHVDQQFPHIVALYYVNDTDGDTIFCDENDHSKIIHRETPKKGKCVIFEGLHAYHASSSPTKNIRMTLNINYDHL